MLTVRSMASMISAAANTGAASRPRIDVVKMPQTNIGRRVQVMPGARSPMMVASILMPEVTSATAIRAKPTI